MILHIPDSVISAFWGCIAMGLSTLGVLFFGIKNKSIPLNWGTKKMEPEGISAIEFEEKLKVHCSKRQQDLNGQLTDIKDTLKEMGKLIGEMSSRLVRMETISEMDHK